MKSIPTLLLALIFSLPFVQAQVTDNFSDGDFTMNPEWFGNTDRFQINTGELQLNDVNYDSPVSSLYTLAPTQGNTTWEFYVRLDFNPSASNYARVYLASDQTDFAGSLNGYFVLIGSTDDLVELRRQTGTSTSVVVAGTPDVIDVSVPEVRVRVTRDAASNWTLEVDYAGGTSYTTVGTGFDDTHTTGTYYGVRCNYTSTRKDKFFFDDFSVNPTFMDNDPPELLSATANSATEVVLTFNEPLDPGSFNTGSFSLNGGVTVTGAMIDPSNPAQVILTVSPMTNLSNYTVSAEVDDLFGNTGNDSANFLFAQGEIADPFDIIINEFMADPTPQVGLPDAEFVEIYNRSNKVIDLDGYGLASGGSPQVLPAYLLLPGEYVVVTDDGNLSGFSALGVTNIVVVGSFAALTNGGDVITLSDDLGTILDEVNYDDTWYQDSNKDDGGWTLERINPDNPCDVSGENWIASTNPFGGTPGAENSVFDNSTGGSSLGVTSATTLSNSQVEVTFSTSPDATEALDPSNYDIDNGIGNPASITAVGANVYVLNLGAPLSGNITYTVTVSDVNDCSGNSLIDPANDSATFALPEPEVLSVIAVYPTQEVVVTFNTPMDASTAGNTSNYNIPGLGNPTSVNIISPTQVELIFTGGLENGTSYELEISGTADLDGTLVVPVSLPFVYYEPVTVETYDIIINEIMPNPSGATGVPAAEFMELYNRSDKIISLENFTFASGTTSSDPFPFVVLGPGEYVIVYEREDGIDFGSFGDTIVLEGNVSMTNDGDDLSLIMPDGTVCDALEYTRAWYQDTDRDDGGFSLERINPSAPCEGASNWRASLDILGATPGAANSVLDDEVDDILPDVSSAFPSDAQTVVVSFTEALDPVAAIDAASYSIDQGITILSANANAPLYNTVTLVLDPSTPLTSSTLYQLTVASTVTDCVGNPFGMLNTVDFALPETPEEGDIIVNEVLFDPIVGGVDFIELYNNSNKIINLGDFTIKNDLVSSSSGSASVETDYLFFPQTYVVLTENPGNILARYTVENPNVMLTNDLPTLSADEGNVTLFVTGTIIDKFTYFEDWHFELLDETKGVSLERLDFDGETNDRNNWHSAAASAGFATPTYLNSQYIANPDAGTEEFVFADDTFSPDNDGNEDVLRLDYAVESNDYVINIKVFDARGRIVRNLVENETLATNGFYQWDGTNDAGEKARIGIYVFWIQLFEPNGLTREIKKTCVLAGQF